MKNVKQVYNKFKSRRWLIAVGWAVLNYTTTYLQPILNLNAELVRLLIEKSAWIAGLLIVGLSGTNALRDYVKNNKAKKEQEQEFIDE